MGVSIDSMYAFNGGGGAFELHSAGTESSGNVVSHAPTAGAVATEGEATEGEATECKAGEATEATEVIPGRSYCSKSRVSFL